MGTKYTMALTCGFGLPPLPLVTFENELEESQQRWYRSKRAAKRPLMIFPVCRAKVEGAKHESKCRTRTAVFSTKLRIKGETRD